MGSADGPAGLRTQLTHTGCWLRPAWAGHPAGALTRLKKNGSGMPTVWSGSIVQSIGQASSLEPELHLARVTASLRLSPSPLNGQTAAQYWVLAGLGNSLHNKGSVH